MNVIITGRRFNVSNSLKNAIEEKLGRIRVLYNAPLHFHVLLEKEKLNYSADITFSSGGKKFYLQMKAPTISEAVDKLIDKLERQVRKHKERLQKHHHERVTDKQEAAFPGLRYVEIPKEPRAELDVLLKLANSEQECEVFHSAENPEKAVAALQESDELFVLYGCDPADGNWYCKQVYLVNDEIDRTHIEDCHPESMDDAHAALKLEKEESALFVYKNAEANKMQAMVRDQGELLVYVLEK